MWVVFQRAYAEIDRLERLLEERTTELNKWKSKAQEVSMPCCLLSLAPCSGRGWLTGAHRLSPGEHGAREGPGRAVGAAGQEGGGGDGAEGEAQEVLQQHRERRAGMVRSGIYIFTYPSSVSTEATVSHVPHLAACRARSKKCQELQLELNRATSEFETAQTRLVQLEREHFTMTEQLSVVGVRPVIRYHGTCLPFLTSLLAEHVQMTAMKGSSEATSVMVQDKLEKTLDELEAVKEKLRLATVRRT